MEGVGVEDACCGEEWRLGRGDRRGWGGVDRGPVVIEGVVEGVLLLDVFDGVPLVLGLPGVGSPVVGSGGISEEKNGDDVVAGGVGCVAEGETGCAMWLVRWMMSFLFCATFGFVFLYAAASCTRGSWGF